jgi:acyl-CoA thioesterase FadM
MNLYLRVMSVVVAALRAGPLGPFDTSRLDFRTMPGDLDLNGHMNNGRYLTLMDLGRVDLSVRTGIHRVLLAHAWKPVVASEIVRFRKSLHLGERFVLTSRILGWDHRSVYVEHRMERGEEIVAIGIVRGMFIGTEGAVAPERIARAIGHAAPPPRLPGAIRAWREAEQTLLGGQGIGERGTDRAAPPRTTHFREVPAINGHGEARPH